MKIKILFFFLILNLIINSIANAEPASATGSVLTTTAKGAATSQVQGAAAQKVGEATGIGEKLKDMLDTPVGIMVVSAIGGVNAGILYSAAAKQEKDSEDNIKKIDRILSEFKDSYANFCPNGREKLEEPSCYCYLENGKQNSNRSNSQICQQLWTKNKYVYDNTVGNYAGTGVVDPAGCLAVNGQFDENCTCKKLINSSGSNACMKTVALNVNGNALGSAFVKASGFDSVMKNLASTASGNPNLNDLSSRQLGLAIAKQNDINNGLYNKIAADPKKKMFPQFTSNEQIEAIAKNVIGPKEMAAFGKSSSLLASVGNSLPPETAKIIDDVKKKVGLDLSGGAGLGSAKKADKKGNEFNFMDAGNTAQAGQVQNFPETEKNYKYKNSDIVTDQGASIFEIISNRYVESGLKRLFETPEEKAAE